MYEIDNPIRDLSLISNYHLNLAELRLSEEKYNIRKSFLNDDKQVNELSTQPLKVHDFEIENKTEEILLTQSLKFPDFEIENKTEEIQPSKVLDFKIENKTEEILSTQPLK
ncbi:3460_t:CDS:2, partial [Dentiscutata heterogama]